MSLRSLRAALCSARCSLRIDAVIRGVTKAITKSACQRPDAGDRPSDRNLVRLSAHPPTPPRGYGYCGALGIDAVPPQGSGFPQGADAFRRADLREGPRSTPSKLAENGPFLARKEPLTVATLRTVVRKGDYRASLEALRDYLAKALDDTDSARDQASLSLRLADVLTRLHELDEEAQPDDSDDLDALLVLPS